MEECKNKFLKGKLIFLVYTSASLNINIIISFIIKNLNSSLVKKKSSIVLVSYVLLLSADSAGENMTDNYKQLINS